MSAESRTPATRKQDSAVVPASEQRARRWEPASLFEEMQADLARMMDVGPFGLFPFGRSLRRMPAIPAANMPRVDVFERDNTLVMKAELPGIKKEDVDLEITDGDLVLRAERKEESEVKEENWYRMERSYGSLYRRLPLPEGVQSDQIKAELQDGVLEVTIPRPQATEQKPHKIAVK